MMQAATSSGQDASSTNALVAWDFDAREPHELSLRRGASLDT
jgi:hypothetical protein